MAAYSEQKTEETFRKLMNGQKSLLRMHLDQLCEYLEGLILYKIEQRDHRSKVRTTILDITGGIYPERKQKKKKNEGKKGQGFASKLMNKILSIGKYLKEDAIKEEGSGQNGYSLIPKEEVASQIVTFQTDYLDAQPNNHSHQKSAQ